VLELDLVASAKTKRTLTVLVIAAFIAAGGATLYRYQGLGVPVRIASGSMAEQFLGPHRTAVCEQCGFRFRCGLDIETPLQLATCPNCGFRKIDISHALVYDGERVIIDRWTYLQSNPQRGDVVAFIDSANQSEFAVKRVVGLPRETISIRGGDLFVDGDLFRKSLDETKQLATHVHDDTYRLAANESFPTRWKSDATATGWRTTSTGYEWTPTGPSESNDDWLMYRHWRCYSSPKPRTEESPVTDNNAYNQGLSRELHEVTDLLLSCKVTLTESGEVAFLLHDGHEPFVAKVSAKNRSVTLLRGEDVIVRAMIPVSLDARRTSIEFGVIDQQLLVAVAGQPLVRHSYTPQAGSPQPVSRPVGIAARDGACSISSIKIHRDIYYLAPQRIDQASSEPLDDGAYFVLGDNSPLSRDSRQWSEPGVRREQIIGKVLKLPRSTSRKAAR
jgi:Signal peptidase, peptidase S26